MKIDAKFSSTHPWNYPRVRPYFTSRIGDIINDQPIYFREIEKLLAKTLFKGDDIISAMLDVGGLIIVNNSVRNDKYYTNKAEILGDLFRYDKDFATEFFGKHIDKTPMIILRKDGENYNTEKGEIVGAIVIYEEGVGTTQAEKEDYLRTHCPLYVLES